MSVKVAVRVRPFNQRENEMNCVNCVAMAGNTTTLTNPANNQTRDFTFDYSFWSHDDFNVREDGYFVAKNSKYSDQQKVFNTVGTEILNNAWEGYHCCLFAYGQTGSGKSYSMIGYGANKGIVPISCEEIFKRINKNSQPNVNYEVMVSMLEIYNEKIQDLLIPIKKRPQGGLKVRENKIFGVYVEDLTKHPVDSYDAINEKTEEGNRNRTIGSTQMNASSSRAHTIITIEFRVKEVKNNIPTEKLSVINLVDLAGSEKLDKTGATGDRMKEGCAINKSLTVLGIVISKLAENSTGKGKGEFVPFRESALTRILQNALGGNSKTLMICALSPATDNYEETLSTLKYADQAKKIKCHAVVNESETDKMIRMLKEENEKLKEMLSKISAGGPKAVLEMGHETMEQLVEELEGNSKFMAEMSTPFEQKLIEQKKIDEEDKTELIDTTKPHLTVLHEDPLMNQKIHYSLQDEITHIGRKNGNPVPKIILGGVGLRNNHAIIKNCKDGLTIEPTETHPDSNTYVYLNGDMVVGVRTLGNLDRLIIGPSAYFLVRIPDTPNPANLPQIEEIDCTFAQNELIQKSEELKKIQDLNQKMQRQKEMDDFKKESDKRILKEKEEYELQLKKQEEEFTKKLKELEEKQFKDQSDEMKQKLEKEHQDSMAKIEAQKNSKEKEVLKEIEAQRFKMKDKDYLEHKLAQYLPTVVEMNLMAKELKRNIYFNAKLAQIHLDSEEESHAEDDDKTKNLKIQIKVFNREEGVVYNWDVEKLNIRYFLVKDILDKYFETNQLPALKQNQDPFWDPPESQLIARAYLKMMSLGYMMDNPSEISLVGEKGVGGSLKVNLIPTDAKGEKNLAEEMDSKAEYIEDPRELIGNRLDFKVEINYASLPEDKYCCKDTYCEYGIMVNEKEYQNFKTETVYGNYKQPAYKYVGLHTYHKLTDQIITYLSETNLCFKLFGVEAIPQQITIDFNSSKSSMKSDQSSSQKEKDGETAHEGGIKSDTTPKQSQKTTTNIENKKEEKKNIEEKLKSDDKKNLEDKKKKNTDDKNKKNTDDKSKKNNKDDCSIF